MSLSAPHSVPAALPRRRAPLAGLLLLAATPGLGGCAWLGLEDFDPTFGIFEDSSTYAGDVQPTIGPPPPVRREAVIAPELQPRPASPDTYPSLADVPEMPGDIPSIRERIAVRTELESDRDRALSGVPAAPPAEAAPGAAMAAAAPPDEPAATAGPPTTVLFGPENAELTAETLALLRQVAERQQAAASRVLIIGFAGDDLDGDTAIFSPMEQDLALDRGNAIARELVRLGVLPTMIAVRAGGPVPAGGDPATGRRAEIYLQ